MHVDSSNWLSIIQQRCGVCMMTEKTNSSEDLRRVSDVMRVLPSRIRLQVASDGVHSSSLDVTPNRFIENVTRLRFLECGRAERWANTIDSLPPAHPPARPRFRSSPLHRRTVGAAPSVACTYSTVSSYLGRALQIQVTATGTQVTQHGCLYSALSPCTCLWS